MITFIILTRISYNKMIYNSSLIYTLSTTFWISLHPKLLLRVPDAHKLSSETSHTLKKPRIKLLISPMKITMTMDSPISVGGGFRCKNQTFTWPMTPTSPPLNLKIRKSKLPYLKHQSRIQPLLPWPPSWSSNQHPYPDYSSILFLPSWWPPWSQYCSQCCSNTECVVAQGRSISHWSQHLQKVLVAQ